MSSAEREKWSIGAVHGTALPGAARPTLLPRFSAAQRGRLTASAFNRAIELKRRLAYGSPRGWLSAKLLANDLSRGDVRSAGPRCWQLLARAAGGRLGDALALWRSDALALECRKAMPAATSCAARFLVVLYFLSLAFDHYSAWAFMQQPEVLQRAQHWPQHFPNVRFPYLSLLALLPASLAAGAGLALPLSAGLLLVWEGWEAAGLIAGELLNLVAYGLSPNELMVKRLAMLGSVAILLASAARERSDRHNSCAGLLLGGGSLGSGSGRRQQQPSPWRSVLLLAGRLAMASLFLFVGIAQMQRVAARRFVLWSHLPHSQLWARDGHDNCLLLVELALALPLALGWRTNACSKLLAGTLLLEASTCWRFWASWPTRAYAAHVRLHHVTCCGVAGGLLLLARTGAGRYTLDAALEKKRK